MPDKKEAVEVICPKCRRTEIIFLPKEDVPKCEVCNISMVLSELLTEGKSY